MIENSVATVENAITVGNHTLPIKEYNNVRVVTFKDIDMVTRDLMELREKGLMITRNTVLKKLITLKLNVQRYVRFSDRPLQMAIIQKLI